MRVKQICTSVILIWIICSAGTLFAGESTGDDGWDFYGELYFWGASVGGESATGSDIDLDFGDIISDVNFAFMGSAGASKGKWSLGADLIYLNIDDSGEIAPGVSANVELTNWVITPLVGYNIANTGKSRLDVVGGARYLYMKVDLRVAALGARVDDSGSNWDAVIGARGTVDLSQNWYLLGYLDIGTGESDLTWQGLGGVGYSFKHFDLVAAYRYLSWEFDDGQAVDDLQLHGPGLGIRFAF